MLQIARPLALVLLCGPLAAQTPAGDMVGPGISRFEAGIICAPEVVGTSEAPDTVAGVTNIIVGDPPFVSHGRQVPAVLGMGFGLRTLAKGPQTRAVRIEVTHPPMGPEGRTTQSYDSLINGTGLGPSMTFYQFDYSYELVEGPWTFVAREGDEVLFRSSFTVVPPAMVPELAAICGYEDLLS